MKFGEIQLILTFLFVILGLILFGIWQNNHIVLTTIEFSNTKIPNDFNGYTIVQISDLHNKEFKQNQSGLLNKIEKVKPDIIVVTGDLIDSRRTNVDIAMDFINGAVNIAPVYFVSGNHEARSGVYGELTQKLREAGVFVLDDTVVEIENKDSFIELVGLSDPAFIPSNYMEDNPTAQLRESLKTLTADNPQTFKILLSHRPELLDLYAENKLDLVFSGHAHGGQFRLPLIGGLIAPGQGFFPKYTSGAYTVEGTTMVVSRGLGNSIIPIRIFNRPEVIIVTLQNKLKVI
ncbi:metallophosphoesterase [Alkaliphilus metalliredigens]|nr:metallophosphoesterase [Alkaliphilus metalliredigens]